MDKPNQIKCHVCGKAADDTFAYARFNEREAFKGVIYRGVCRACLHAYIETIKKDRNLRGELLLWPAVFIPIGALLAAFSGSMVSRIIGYGLLGLAVVMPVYLRLWQRREAWRATLASDAENEQRYSEQMCREDALRTSSQTKLIFLRPEYKQTGYDSARIAQETGIAPTTGVLLKKLAAAAYKGLR